MFLLKSVSVFEIKTTLDATTGDKYPCDGIAVMSFGKKDNVDANSGDVVSIGRKRRIIPMLSG